MGCSLQAPSDFLAYLNEQEIPVTLRQVTIPTLNDNEETILAFKAIAEKHSCVDKTELLPFRKICQVKYDKMGLKFRFAHLPEPTRDRMNELNRILSK